MSESRGLGDTIAKITTAVRIRPCAGCNARQQRLNQIFPYERAQTEEEKQREAVVLEALSWERTPFVNDQCVKGVAADCATFAAAPYAALGVFRADIPHLQPDWFFHSTKQEYVDEIRKHATEFDIKEREPQPADVLIVQDTAIGAKVFSHGCIVIKWPHVIHCFPPCVMRSNVTTYPAFIGRKLLLFNPWEKPKP